MGLPAGWSVYAQGPGYARPPDVAMVVRCDAWSPVAEENLMVRCLLVRGHDGYHMVHPRVPPAVPL